MDYIDKLIKKELEYDPLDAAEKITGRRYGNTFQDPTVAIGFLLMQDQNAKKEALMALTDDTGFSNDLANYQRIIAEEGFTKVLEIPFVYDRWDKNRPRNEKFFIYWHSQDAILLAFDTYDEVRINGGKFYYNWIHKDENAWGSGVTSSGHCTKNETTGELVWVGDHDCREALRFHIRQLRENGKFVNPWFERTWLWLLHYGDTHRIEKEFDQNNYSAISAEYDRIRDERIAMLPDYVLSAIGPKRDR